MGLKSVGDLHNGVDIGCWKNNIVIWELIIPLVSGTVGIWRSWSFPVWWL